MVKAFELGDLVVWRYDHAEGAEVFRGDVGTVIPLDSDDAQGVVRIAPKIWRGYKAPCGAEPLVLGIPYLNISVMLGL